MKCQDRIFTNTDIVIPIAFEGVLISDIQELSVKFVNRVDPTINKTYLLSDEDIVIDGESITVNVSKTDITTAGEYDIHMKRTNLSGKVIGVVPCPSSVIFYPML